MRHDIFVVYEPIDCNISEWFDYYDNVVYVKTPLHSEHRYKKYLHGLFYWPKIYKTENFDIFETFNLPLTRGNSELALLTIHDIRGLHLEAPWINRMLHNMVLKVSIKRADHVVTVSKCMKSEICNHYPDVPVSVIYNGIDTKNVLSASNIDIKNTMSKFMIPSEYILSVGHFEPRKNYISLLKALKILHMKGLKEHLIIVGNDSGGMKLVRQTSALLGLTRYVKILNNITNQELKIIYKKAKLFVFPSLYEGFGIPILESMAANIPIVASDIPIFREILGDGGKYFDCNNIDSMANIIMHEIRLSGRKTLNQNKYEMILGLYSFQNASYDLKNLYRSEAE